MSRIAESAFGDRPYPESPGYKELTTSKDAARIMKSRAGDLRERVYTAIRAAGMLGLTADQAAAAIGESVLAIRPRVTELAKTERIERTGERRVNESGLHAAVWRAV